MSKTFHGGLRFRRAPHPSLEPLWSPPQALTFSLASADLCSFRDGDLVGSGACLCEATDTHSALFSAIGGHVCLSDSNDGSAVLRLEAMPDTEPTPTLSIATGSLATMNHDTLSALICRAGISLPAPTEAEMRLLIVDCGGGPYNASRLTAAETDPEALVGGTKILMKYYGVRSAVFAVPASARSIATHIEAYLPRRSSFLRVELLKDKYPQSEEHLLVCSLKNTEIHASRSCISLGYPIVTPYTCIAVYRALAHGTPLTSVPITLTATDGTARVSMVPLGTSLAEIPERMGITVRENETLVHAEGLSGLPITDKETVTVSTEALRLVEIKATTQAEKQAACIGCRRCADVCPAHLMPMLLYRAITEQSPAKITALDPTACLGCGCCSAVCPSKLPLSETFSSFRASNGGFSL